MAGRRGQTDGSLTRGGLWPRSRNQRGTTFVEALVALSLFGVGAAAVANLLSQHIRMQGTNGTTTAAISLAEEELEDIRALEYADITSRWAVQVVGGTTYGLQTNVVANAPEANMKTIQTTVTWAEPSGAKEYALYAIYTDVTH